MLKRFNKLFSNLFSNIKQRSEIVKGQTKLPGSDSSSVFGMNALRVVKWSLFFAVLVILLALKTSKPNFLPKLNEVAKFDIIAPYTIKVIDEKKTDEMKDELIRSVRDKYKFDKTVVNEVLKSVDEIFTLVKTIRSDNKKSQLTDDEVEKRISAYKISFKSVRTMMTMTDEALEKTRKSLNKLFETLMSVEIPAENLTIAKSEASLKLKGMSFDDETQKTILDLFDQNVRPNYVYDKETTQKMRDNLVANAVAIERHIAEGEIIIRHGEIVKADHLEIFKKYNLYESSTKPWLIYVSAALIVFFAGIVVIIYLLQNKGEIFKQESLLTMMALIILSILVIAKIVDFMAADRNVLSAATSNDNSFYSPYIVPIPAAAILIALLIDMKLAIIINLILTIFVEMILGHSNLNFLIVNIMSGTVAVLNVKNVNQRTDLTKAGIMVSFTNVFLITAYALLEYNVINSSYYSNLMKNVVWGFFNGFISAIFAIGMLPYLESIFKVSTSMRMLELSDLNQALLRRLLLEAPGTYHHSIIVGNLAEAAAKDIGADALLCRVGSYYHDIGKLKRPMFFVENQNQGPNVHENIKPNLSAKVIMSHTKDGYEIGVEYQLPQEILDIILQHHGTNLMSYFYLKAISAMDSEKNSKEELIKEEYRYPGPKPQSRESAIILLADAVEASFRTLAKPSISSIESLVKKIKNDRFNDAQFDECNITLKDLEMISSSFVRIIAGMYHSRIEYPDADKVAAGKQKFPGQPSEIEQQGPACPVQPQTASTQIPASTQPPTSPTQARTVQLQPSALIAEPNAAGRPNAEPVHSVEERTGMAVENISASGEAGSGTGAGDGAVRGGSLPSGGSGSSVSGNVKENQ